MVEKFKPSDVYPASCVGVDVFLENARATLEEFDIVEFRVPEIGESFLADSGRHLVETMAWHSPRFILKKKKTDQEKLAEFFGKWWE